MKLLPAWDGETCVFWRRVFGEDVLMYYCPFYKILSWRLV